MNKDKIEIFSYYDGWTIGHKGVDNDWTDEYTWDHNDSENGVGGEKLFYELLKNLGYEVTFKEEF